MRFATASFLGALQLELINSEDSDFLDTSVNAALVSGQPFPLPPLLLPATRKFPELTAIAFPYRVRETVDHILNLGKVSLSLHTRPTQTGVVVVIGVAGVIGELGW